MSTSSHRTRCRIRSGFHCSSSCHSLTRLRWHIGSPLSRSNSRRRAGAASGRRATSCSSTTTPTARTHPAVRRPAPPAAATTLRTAGSCSARPPSPTSTRAPRPRRYSLRGRRPWRTTPTRPTTGRSIYSSMTTGGSTGRPSAGCQRPTCVAQSPAPPRLRRVIVSVSAVIATLDPS